MRNMKPFCWRMLLAAALCALALGANAQPAQPAAPEAAARVEPAFEAGETLNYEFGWNGITAAEGKVWVEKGRLEDAEVYTFRMTARTSSTVDKLYEFRTTGWSIASADTLLPLQNRTSKTENGHKTTETLVFEREQKLAAYTRESQSDAAKPPSIKNSTIRCENPADPFAFAYVLRSQKLAVGDVKKTQLIVGRHLYDVSVTVAGRERIKVQAGTFDALRLVPSFHEVGKSADTSKVRTILLWVSDDDRHLPLKATAEAFIGHVYGELTRIETTPKPALPAGGKL